MLKCVKCGNEMRAAPNGAGQVDARTGRILKQIAEDMKNDAAAFDGRPFNGRTVAEYFGNQGAAIAALAGIIKTILPDESA